MEYRKMLFMKRIKLPMKRIANAMPVGFTDQQFYEAYKKYYPYMMDEAQKMCKDYKRHNCLRKQKGYKNTVYFPETDELLKQASKSIIGRTRKAHDSGEVATDEELARNIASLEKDSKEKIAKRKQKEDPIYNSGKSDKIMNDIIPLLLKHNVIVECSTAYTQQTNLRAWRLKHIDVSDVYKAEEDSSSTLHAFWVAVHEHE